VVGCEEYRIQKIRANAWDKAHPARLNTLTLIALKYRKVAPRITFHPGHQVPTISRKHQPQTLLCLRLPHL